MQIVQDHTCFSQLTIILFDIYKEKGEKDGVGL